MNYAKVAAALRSLADALDDEVQEDAAPKKRKPAATEDDDEPAPKKRKPAPAEEDDEPAPKKKPAAKKPAPADDDDGEDRDYEKDIRPHVVGLSKDHGREVALEVLEQFTNPATDEPCTKGAEVDPADWDKLLAKIKKARAKLEAEAD